jgi:phage FluMu protein Com
MAFTFKIKKRCRFCGTVLREDGTCPNEKCPRYVPEVTEPEEPKQEEPADEA